MTEGQLNVHFRLRALLEVYYFLSLTPSVRLSRSLKLLLLFLFVDGIQPFFGHQFSMWHSTKLFSQIFIQAPNAQNLLPKICTKSPITPPVWQIDRRCLHLPGGFLGWPIQWNHAKCCGADPCCHGNEIWARCGDPAAYRLSSLSSCEGL